MRNIGLKACALGLALVVGGYSGLSEAADDQLLEKALILRLSVDKLRECLNPDNPGYLDVAGHPDTPGYPGTPGYQGPESLNIGWKMDPMDGFYTKQAKDVLTALAKAKLTEQDYRGIIKGLDQNTSRDFYAVRLKALITTRMGITKKWLRGTGVEERDMTALAILDMQKKAASKEEYQSFALMVNYDLLGQLIQLVAHNCETQGFR